MSGESLNRLLSGSIRLMHKTLLDDTQTRAEKPLDTVSDGPCGVESKPKYVLVGAILDSDGSRGVSALPKVADVSQVIEGLPPLELVCPIVLRGSGVFAPGLAKSVDEVHGLIEATKKLEVIILAWLASTPKSLGAFVSL